MNMGTAMKAVGTGWKQSGTTDNGKCRDAGKADFADTFTEMLKACLLYTSVHNQR